MRKKTHPMSLFLRFITHCLVLFSFVKVRGGHVSACVRVCVCACVRVRVRVRVCPCESERGAEMDEQEERVDERGR